MTSPRLGKTSIFILFVLFSVISIALYISEAPPLFLQKHAKSKALVFDVEPADLVAMSISDTSRYEMSAEGQKDYAALMPSGGHTIHISTPDDPTPRTYTVALFHQLKCLEIYHREYLKPLPRQVTPELQGCLNYLRQSLLCHADTRLESVKNKAVQAEKQYETVCRDWTKVYEAAERNYMNYEEWKSMKLV